MFPDSSQAVSSDAATSPAMVGGLSVIRTTAHRVRHWWFAHPTARSLTYAALCLLVLTVFALAYLWSPWWIDGIRLHKMTAKDETTALAADRDEVLKIVAGFAAAVAVIYTVRRHNIDRRTLEATQRSVAITQIRDAETVRLTTEAQVTDRYIKVIGLLASDKPDERIGGIYALERLMADSPRDHSTIVEVLAAFIRRISPAVIPAHPAPPTGTPTSGLTDRQEPAAELVAAIIVLLRRPPDEKPHAVDLRRTNLAGLELLYPGDTSPLGLAGADLRGADLTGANLSELDLTGIDLCGADLTRIYLRGAVLTRALFSNANLTRSYLGRANLEDAVFRKANMAGVDLFRSDLSRARFEEADLTGAQLVRANLTHAILRGAILIGADLADANLDSAIFSDANLTKANLGRLLKIGADHPLLGVHLDGADLTDTIVSAAQLSGAYITDATTLPSSLANDPWIHARLEACHDWFAVLEASGRGIPGDLDGLSPTPDPKAAAST